jgi:carbamoyl-phosphate synthase large subunit
MEIGISGFDEVIIDGVSDKNSLDQNQEIIKKDLKAFSPNRILKIAQAIRSKISLEEIAKITYYDLWFLREIEKIILAENELKSKLLDNKSEEYLNNKFQLLKLKKLGLSDARIANILGKDEFEIADLRKKLGVNPVFKRVDTCSAEFESHTQYMYSCYEGDSITEPDCEAGISNNKKIIILGAGPNRIGQGIEFDYACVHAAFAMKEIGIESIMINCNPETVSTDYDTSDRLYFEPMTPEYVLEIVRKEQENGNLLGVIVQFGGQTALKLAKYLDKFGITILGTSFDKIDLAEDRERFQKLLHKINLIQPDNRICHNIDQIEPSINEIGYPAVIRPSNVLGGRAMEIIYDKKSLLEYIKINSSFILNGPILVDKFLENAIEIDVDALCDGTDVEVVGIMEHIEEAGIHSGDSACSIPPYSLSKDQIQEIKDTTVKLAKEIEICGLMNIQYAIKDNKLYIIEVNPRASRTAPFVAKATGINIIKIASNLLIGKKLSDFDFSKNNSKDYYSVKEVVFPFVRFAGSDVLLGPEMKSTGEVMGIDKNFEIAFMKSQIAANHHIPTSGGALISVNDKDKNNRLIKIVQRLQKNHFNIFATDKTAKFLSDSGLKNITLVKKEYEGSENIISLIKDDKIQIAINTNSGKTSIIKSYNFRRELLMNQVYYVTTLNAAEVMSKSFNQFRLNNDDLDVVCIQDI